VKSIPGVIERRVDLVSGSRVFLWIIREAWKEKGTFESIQGMKLDEADVVWGYLQLDVAREIACCMCILGHVP
jgi:hypothetical protein